jgi:hypothetical protein
MDFMASTVSLTALPPCSASRGLGGHVVGDLGVLGVLGDRGGHLLDGLARGGGDLLDRAACSLEDLRQRLGGGGDLADRPMFTAGRSRRPFDADFLALGHQQLWRERLPGLADGGAAIEHACLGRVLRFRRGGQCKVARGNANIIDAGQPVLQQLDFGPEVLGDVFGVAVHFHQTQGAGRRDGNQQE